MARRALGQFLIHHPGIGRVRDDEVLVVRQPVDDEIVKHPAVGCANHRVPCPAWFDGGQVTGECVVERGPGGAPRDRDLAHMREVEQPRGAANGVVLVGLTGVAQRHQPPGEWRQRGSQATVYLKQRSGLLSTLCFSAVLGALAAARE